MMPLEECRAEYEAYLLLKEAIQAALKGSTPPRRTVLLRWATEIDRIYQPIRERIVGVVHSCPRC